MHDICDEHKQCTDLPAPAPAPAPPLSTQKLMCYVYVEVQTWRLPLPRLARHGGTAARP